MEFLKKNYEKVLLGLVLLGLAVAVGFLLFKVSAEKAALEEQRVRVINRPAKPLPPQDLQKYDVIVKRFQARASLDLSTTNKLFNAVPWQKTADGRLLKIQTGNEVGPAAVAITRITPLYLTITFDAMEQADTNAPPRYRIGVENEAAASAAKRRKGQRSASVGQKNDVFVLREVKGPPTEPTELVLELNDTSEVIAVSKDKPFRRVDAYMADMKYDPEKITWTQKRVGAPLRFAGEDYNIVAITQNEVVLSAKSNNKKWPIKYNPAAGGAP